MPSRMRGRFIRWTERHFHTPAGHCLRSTSVSVRALRNRRRSSGRAQWRHGISNRMWLRLSPLHHNADLFDGSAAPRASPGCVCYRFVRERTDILPTQGNRIFSLACCRSHRIHWRYSFSGQRHILASRCPGRYCGAHDSDTPGRCTGPYLTCCLVDVSKFPRITIPLQRISSPQPSRRPSLRWNQ